MALTKVPSNLDAAVSTTQSASDNSTNVATTAYVTTAIANLSDSAPAALNTLNEIAAALGDDANYASTTTAAIAAKLPLAGGTMTGDLAMGSNSITSTGTISSGAITSSGSLKATDYRVNEGNSLAGGLFKEKNVSGSGSSNDLSIFAEGISNGGNIHFMTGGSATVRATIDSSGKVGIGTTGPTVPLTVNNSTDNSDIAIFHAGGGTPNRGLKISTFSATNANAGVDLDAQMSTGVLSFSTGGAERMRINHNRKVTIGQTTEFGHLTVNSEGAPDTSGNMTSGIIVCNTAGGNAIKLGVHDSGALNYLQSGYVNNANVGRNFGIFVGAGEMFRIKTDGTVHITSGATPIDPTIKHANAAGDNAKLRLINRAGQSTNKGGVLEMGAVTDDGVSRSDVFASIAGLKTNATSNNREGYLQLSTSNGSTLIERMRVASNGDIHFKCGSSQPSASVVGWEYHDTASAYPWVKQSVGGTGGLTHYQFYNPNGAVGQIFTSGSSTTYSASSDYRLKENVEYTWDATTLLKQLKPCKFNFIKEEDGAKPTLQGFLAHEVSNIVPGAVRYTKDAVDSEGEPEYQQMDPAKLVPLLVKTIQELEARITTLEG